MTSAFRIGNACRVLGGRVALAVPSPGGQEGSQHTAGLARVVGLTPYGRGLSSGVNWGTCLMSGEPRRS